MSAAQDDQQQSEEPHSNGNPYSDDNVARICGSYIDIRRIKYYKDTLTGILKKHGCNRILDAACGTGIDSMMLIEEGFKVVSVDDSEKMLKYALRAREEKKYDEWIIEKGNWESLPSDLEAFLPEIQFDAIFCLGNSFAHVLDEHGDQRTQKLCLKNFNKCLKPGGLLFIDHRNFDDILNGGSVPNHSIYYDWHQIKSTVMLDSGKPKTVTLQYYVQENTGMIEFSLSLYLHKLENFTKMLDEAFDNRAKHDIYADFKPMGQVPVPGFYIHVLEKSKE
ncbi:unnamed protein product [Arctia plantaginis]|uniref:Glycine N-methyltransferase n=1 Tax=Arctia plantaginis TaxID=874455 RepID=A0A8S0YT50_ARCPL|nr:unnamed protein product [Arctia plantaginis]